MAHFFYSLITFCIALFFILFGFIGVILSLSVSMQTLAIHFISQQPLFIFLFSVSVLAVGILTVLNVFSGLRRHYFHLKVKGEPVTVDSAVIQSYVKKYLQELFPGKEIPYQLEIKKNTIYLTLDLPHVQPEEQSAMLDRIGNELRERFTSFLGYEHPFHLTASFQKSKENHQTSLDE